MARNLGRLPEAYLHVPLAMIPKGDALRPDQHRGITIFSMLHRLVYGAMWHRLKDWQEQWIDNKQQGGRARGEYIADAWDLQVQIEEAQHTDTQIVGALLDYGKFFDNFHPELVRGLMEKAGLPF